MNWDDLRIFLSVARTGQIARAATLLALDATTVSRRLRRLEQELGRTLFETRRDGQRLTSAGERLVSHAEAMEVATRHIAEEDTSRSAPSGLVRASVSEGFSSWFVAPHLHAFAQQYPRIAVDLVATNGFLSPSRREADIAILLERPRKGPVVAHKLTDYGLRVYASATYLENHPAIGQLTDLQHHRLVSYIPDFLYAPELDYLKELSPELSPTLRSSSINVQYRLVAGSAGVGVLPCFIGDTDPTLVRILPDIRIERSFWLVTHQDTRHMRRVRVFADWLRAMANARRTNLLGLQKTP